MHPVQWEPAIARKGNIPRRDIFKILCIPDSLDLDDRATLGRDMFMLSFILAGVNLKDLYELKHSECNDRFTYKRSKRMGNVGTSHLYPSGLNWRR